MSEKLKILKLQRENKLNLLSALAALALRASSPVGPPTRWWLGLGLSLVVTIAPRASRHRTVSC